MPAQPGSQIAGYRVVKLLGSGGMGDVYVVENEQLQRREAMKVISVAGASNADFQQRFANEARTAASLDHPSIITVHSYGVSDDLPWFTMTFLDGPDLASTRLTPAEVVTAIEQVAAGLDYAHGRTIVHRDVKPANIVVTRDSDGDLARAVMLDFGIAKLSDSPQLTAMNSVVGTMAYTAPEIISGKPATGRSDQYSLACTVYNLLTGQAPFSADTATALMMAHIQQPPPPLGQARPDLAPLGPVIERAMAKDPAARYPDCRAFAADLRRALGQTSAGTATGVAPTPAPAPAPVSGPHAHGTPVPTPHPVGRQFANPPSGPHSGPSARPPSGPQQGFGPQPFGGPVSGPHTNPYTGGQPYAAAPGGPGMPPPSAPFGAMGPIGQNPPPGAPKSRRGLWVALALAAVVVLAVAATSPLWWPKSETAPETVAVPTMASSWGAVCAVKDAELYCWGRNDTGQLGDGSTTDRKTPVKITSLKNVTSVAMGSYKTKAEKYATTTCAAADGSAYCWGSNHYNQVGDGSQEMRSTPVKVPGLENVTTVATSYGSSCAIAGEGDLYCWGSGESGQLGTGDTDERVPTPKKVDALTGVTAVVSREATVCAIAEGDALYCWGDNSSGQVGDGTTDRRTTPTKVQNLQDVTSVAVGAAELDNDSTVGYTCATSNGKAFCWGADPTGSAGAKRTVPVEVSGVDGTERVAVDVASMCAINGEKKLQCWGNNKFGQLGTGTSGGTVDQPTAVGSLSEVTSVITATSLTCARTESDMYCWGTNSNGQIGNPQASTDANPTPVKLQF